MADGPDIQADIKQLAIDLKKLEAEYNMFFAGRSPRPPWETRGRVDALIRRWDRRHIETSADRFRFQTLQSRYATFADLWDRGLRAREEGRPGPYALPPPKDRKSKREATDEPKVVHVTAFRDPVQEAEKLTALYDSLMDARRKAGEVVVPFHRFAALVKDQVTKLRRAGSAEVSFRVTVKDGKVNFTVRGLKE